MVGFDWSRTTVHEAVVLTLAELVQVTETAFAPVVNVRVEPAAGVQVGVPDGSVAVYAGIAYVAFFV
jgi:hypothetical protein